MKGVEELPSLGFLGCCCIGDLDDFLFVRGGGGGGGGVRPDFVEAEDFLEDLLLLPLDFFPLLLPSLLGLTVFMPLFPLLLGLLLLLLFLLGVTLSTVVLQLLALLLTLPKLRLLEVVPLLLDVRVLGLVL